MAVFTMENEFLVVEVQEFGAELVSVKNKKTGIEYIWEGNPLYWNRRSPILFPVVGSLKEKKYRYNEMEYSMMQHGFARDMEFTLIEKENQKLVFSLESNDQTLENYPFQFLLEIIYVLRDQNLEVIWKVKNKDNKTMYFQIGAHPAFVCPIKEGDMQSDYFIAFEGLNELNIRMIDMNTGLAKKETKSVQFDEVLNENGYLRITESLFDQDALVVEEKQCTSVQLCNPDKTPYVTVNFDTPLFGVWSPAGKAAPFVCIEPWYGRCDSVDFDGNLEEKEYINALDINEDFYASYSIYFEH